MFRPQQSDIAVATAVSQVPAQNLLTNPTTTDRTPRDGSRGGLYRDARQAVRTRRTPIIGALPIRVVAIPWQVV